MTTTTQDQPAPMFNTVGTVTRSGPNIMIRFHGKPDRFYAPCEDMQHLASGGIMNDTIRLRRRDESQATLFGKSGDLPGGTAALSYSKKLIRLNIPGRDAMTLINVSRLVGVIRGDEQSCPVSVMVIPMEV